MENLPHVNISLSFCSPTYGQIYLFLSPSRVFEFRTFLMLVSCLEFFHCNQKGWAVVGLFPAIFAFA